MTTPTVSFYPLKTRSCSKCGSTRGVYFLEGVGKVLCERCFSPELKKLFLEDAKRKHLLGEKFGFMRRGDL